MDFLYKKCLYVYFHYNPNSSMSLLLVVVLLFFSSSSSVSSHQYYVSDNCSSVTQSPCNPLSVYAGDMSKYSNSTFYFIGINSIISSIKLYNMEYVNLHGLDGSLINCPSEFKISHSDHVYFSNMSFYNCKLHIFTVTNISVTDSFFKNSKINLVNVFDCNLMRLAFANSTVRFLYNAIKCARKLPHYWLTVTNVTFFDGQLLFDFSHTLSYNISITFEDINSRNVYFVLPIVNSLYSIVITQSSFYATYRSGITFVPKGKLKTKQICHQKVEIHSSFVINNSQFYQNRAGLHITEFLFKQNHLAYNHTITISSCIIHDNEYGLYIDGRLFMPSATIRIIDTGFIGNTKGNVILNYPDIYFSNVTISNSLSTGLTLKGSLLTVDNSLTLRNNTGAAGGGIAINDSSYVILLPLSSLEFIDNHASYKGGGIYADDGAYDYCPLRSSTDTNLERYFTFWNNTAEVAGDDLYNIFFNNCVFPFRTKPTHLRSSSDATKLCFCNPNNTGIMYPNCSNFLLPRLHFFPGQKLDLYVILFGKEYNKHSYGHTDGVVSLLIDGVLSNHQYVNNNCSSIEFARNKLTYRSHSLELLIYRNKLEQNKGIQLNFTLHECPIGFNIDRSQGSCTCSQSVSRENVTCDINSLTITHNGLLWIGTYDTSTPFNANATNPNECIINENCLLYCSPNTITFKLNDTDIQCMDNRGQRMCGSCRDGYSLLMGSNKCGLCHSDYTAIGWIALFAVMGFILVVILIALNLTVSVGTLNGLLFYTNIVKLYEPVFSRKGALPVLSQVISWINLDFGFEICFYNGMDSYAKQWLQFAFPLYLWIIIIIIIQLCRRYGKISRLMGSHAVPVLSTLFLLSYTKLVRTIVIVLHKREVTLHCTNESVRSVSLWDEDPNVEYAKGKHAVLAAFALLVSVFFIAPYTLFLLLDPLIEKYLSNFRLFNKLCWSWLKPIIDAYSGPMKDEYRFWPGLLLVARMPVVLSVILSGSYIKSHNFLLSMLLTVLVILLSLSHCFGGVYKKKMNNIIEVWFLFNLCIMVGLSVAYNDDTAVLIWFNICLFIFIASFFVIVLYHFYLQISHTKCFKVLTMKLFTKHQEYDPILDESGSSHKTVDEQMREVIPTSTNVTMRYTALRESVVELY